MGSKQPSANVTVSEDLNARVRNSTTMVHQARSQTGRLPFSRGRGDSCLNLSKAIWPSALQTHTLKWQLGDERVLHFNFSSQGQRLLLDLSNGGGTAAEPCGERQRWGREAVWGVGGNPRPLVSQRPCNNDPNALQPVPQASSASELQGKLRTS